MSIHVFPVPDEMTSEEAWLEIRVFGFFLEGQEVSEEGGGGMWAVMEVDD